MKYSPALALLLLMSTSVLTTLGNFWFTFGIWPRNWQAFVLFGVLAMIQAALVGKVLKEIELSKND